jgi:ABC-type glycerol-3-phosphate transport system substrate-binding protein
MRRNVFAVACTLLLVACGGSPGVSPSPRATGAATAAPTTAEKIELTVWSGHAEDINAILRDRASAFTAANPNITVKIEAVSNPDFLQRLLTAAASGTGPDVTYMGTQWSTSLAAKNLLAPLDRAQFADELAAMPPAAEQSYTENGALIGIPFVFGYFGWDYRVDFMQAAGIQHFPETWSEAADWCQKTVVKDAGGTITREGWDWQYGQASSYLWNQFDGLLRTTGTTIDAGGIISVETPQALAVAQFMWDTIWKYKCAQPLSKRPTPPEGTFPLETGLSSVEFLWPGSAIAHIGYGKDNPDYRAAWDKAPLFPKQDGGTTATLAVGDAWSVWGSSKHKDAAASFVYWLGTYDTQLAVSQGTTMARNDVMLSPDVKQYYADNAPGATQMLSFWEDPSVGSAGQPAFRHPEVPGITKAIVDALIKAMEDPNANLSEVLQGAQAEINPLLTQ